MMFTSETTLNKANYRLHQGNSSRGQIILLYLYMILPSKGYKLASSKCSVSKRITCHLGLEKIISIWWIDEEN
jgi:hypothetical protein